MWFLFTFHVNRIPCLRWVTTCYNHLTLSASTRSWVLRLALHPSGCTWIQRRVKGDDICRESFGSQLWHQLQGHGPHVDPTGANGSVVALGIRRQAGVLHRQEPGFRYWGEGETCIESPVWKWMIEIPKLTGNPVKCLCARQKNSKVNFQLFLADHQPTENQAATIHPLRYRHLPFAVAINTVGGMRHFQTHPNHQRKFRSPYFRVNGQGTIIATTTNNNHCNNNQQKNNHCNYATSFQVHRCNQIHCNDNHCHHSTATTSLQHSLVTSATWRLWMRVRMNVSFAMPYIKVSRQETPNSVRGHKDTAL